MERCLGVASINENVDLCDAFIDYTYRRNG